jgi:hypothetical protein
MLRKEAIIVPEWEPEPPQVNITINVPETV